MKVLVLGATGFVGRWVVEKLSKIHPDADVVLSSLTQGTDLRDRNQTFKLFESTNPDYVINCAAYVGGIQFGYIHPVELFRNNMEMIVNVFEACTEVKVKRLIQPISNCAYPAKESFFKEENFWNGPLHESVLVYGMTRKMMWVGAWAYAKQHGLDTISLILSNMYGPGDHFDEVRSHALGAMIKKVVNAKKNGYKEVVIWGTGSPVREWLYVEDGAEALVRAINIEPYLDIINVGIGEGITVRDLAYLIKDVVQWDGDFVFDTTKPDGAPYKTVDGSKGEKTLGWKPKTELKEGIERAVRYYMDNYHEV